MARRFSVGFREADAALRMMPVIPLPAVVWAAGSDDVGQVVKPSLFLHPEEQPWRGGKGIRECVGGRASRFRGDVAGGCCDETIGQRGRVGDAVVVARLRGPGERDVASSRGSGESGDPETGRIGIRRERAEILQFKHMGVGLRRSRTGAGKTEVAELRGGCGKGALDHLAAEFPQGQVARIGLGENRG